MNETELQNLRDEREDIRTKAKRLKATKSGLDSTAQANVQKRVNELYAQADEIGRKIDSATPSNRDPDNDIVMQDHPVDDTNWNKDVKNIMELESTKWREIGNAYQANSFDHNVHSHVDIGWIKGSPIVAKDIRSLLMTAIASEAGHMLQTTIAMPLQDPTLEVTNTGFANLGKLKFNSPLAVIPRGNSNKKGKDYEKVPELNIKKFSKYIRKQKFDGGYHGVALDLSAYMNLVSTVKQIVEIAIDQKLGSTKRRWVTAPLGLGAHKGNKFLRPSGNTIVSFGDKMKWDGVLHGFQSLPTFVQRIFGVLANVTHLSLNRVLEQQGKGKTSASEQEFSKWLSLHMYMYWDIIPSMDIQTLFDSPRALDPFFPIQAMMNMDKGMIQPSFSEWFVNKSGKVAGAMIQLYTYLQYFISAYKHYFPNNPEGFEMSFMGRNDFAASDNLTNTLKLGALCEIPGNLPGHWMLPSGLNGSDLTLGDGSFVMTPVVPFAGNQKNEWKAGGAPIFDYGSDEGFVAPVGDPDIFKIKVAVGGEAVGPRPALPDKIAVDELYIQFMNVNGQAVVMDKPDPRMNQAPHIMMYWPKRTATDNLTAEAAKFDFIQHSWFLPMLGARNFPKGNRLLVVSSEVDWIENFTKKVR